MFSDDQGSDKSIEMNLPTVEDEWIINIKFKRINCLKWKSSLISMILRNRKNILYMFNIKELLNKDL